ncbi:MAG: pentapeptide repeat-containing protein [Micavibrio aeruginosavorus]|uniref:Pentapeptide repeat-containing protein n=1 Tax=Micavibrio aeruginosavorus TaxID=349221 RepID=A0A7T5R3X8_9BACT|nr:MAG: pentapeptide repeat-containing protein [Micavibrio aeruginosavorus]
MPRIVIREMHTRRPLFAGDHEDVRNCAETAVAQGLSLKGADLRHANLSNAQLDGAQLQRACLQEANLTGANLSESCLDYAVFDNAQLHSAALCEAQMTGASFRGTLFGATDIAGARLNACVFDTLSALDLNFIDAACLHRLVFMATNDMPCLFSQPPLVLRGLSHMVTCLDRTLLLGHNGFHLPFAPQSRETASEIFTFAHRHAGLIEQLASTRTLWLPIDTGKRVA